MGEVDGTKNFLESLCSLPPASKHFWAGPFMPAGDKHAAHSQH